GRITRYPDLCIEVLAQLTRDASVDVRRYAVAALGQFGEHARAATGALVDALNDSDETVNEFAVAILHGLGKLPIEYESSLKQALITSHPYVSRYINLLLSGMTEGSSADNKKSLVE
ncbi:HEAT repeat domain-containing protein, partial [Kaarinaea lacus]